MFCINLFIHFEGVGPSASGPVVFTLNMAIGIEIQQYNILSGLGCECVSPRVACSHSPAHSSATRSGSEFLDPGKRSASKFQAPALKTAIENIERTK